MLDAVQSPGKPEFHTTSHIIQMSMVQEELVVLQTKEEAQGIIRRRTV